MSTKKFRVLALVAVVVIGALVIGVLLIRAPQDDPPAPAEEVRPAPEVADDPPAQETPPAPITTPDEIVPPAGFTAFATMDVQGAAVTHYTGSGTAKDALDAFKTSVIDAGWTPILEEEVPVVHIPESGIAAGATWTGFERGDEFLGIWAMQAQDQTTVTVVIVPKEVLEAFADEVTPAEKEGPPTSDVSGKDIPDVPRYPGSVRTGSVGGTVEYVTSASLDEVLAFYEKELPAHGWTEITPRLQIDEATFAIGAIKGNRELMVQFSRSEDYSDWGPNYTSVFIVVVVVE